MATWTYGFVCQQPSTLMHRWRTGPTHGVHLTLTWITLVWVSWECLSMVMKISPPSSVSSTESCWCWCFCSFGISTISLLIVQGWLLCVLVENLARAFQVKAQKGEKKLHGFFLLALVNTELKLDLGWLRLFVCIERFPGSDCSNVLGTARAFPLEVNRSTSGPAVTPQRVTQRNCPQQGHCCMNFAWLNWWDSCYSHCYMLLVIFLSYVSRMRAKPWDKCCHIRHCQRALRFKGHRVNIDQKHQKLIVGKKYLLYLLLQIAGIDYKPRRRFLSWIWTIYGSDSFLISPYRQTAVFTHFPLFKTWSRNG